MRVLLTHVYGWPEVRRGAERYLHELGAGLLRAGHDVSIVITAPQPRNGSELGVDVRRLRRRHRLQPLLGPTAHQLVFGAQTLPIGLFGHHDVWHAMGTPDAAAAALAARIRRGRRSVMTEMGIPERSWREQQRDHRLFEFAVRHIDEFVCLSPPAADALQRDYGRRASVVPGGVDMSAFVPAAKRAAKPTLLFPGALDEPRKNLPVFLEAVSALSQRGVDVDVWLAGPGEPPSDLTPAARDGLARATLRRSLDGHELRHAYAAAWVTVLPSQAEVFGLVVLESLASGTPAVVNDDGMGPAQLVDDDVGRRSAATADALAEACAAVIELASRPETTIRCRERAADYDWDDVVVPRIIEVYRSGRANYGYPS